MDPHITGEKPSDAPSSERIQASSVVPIPRPLPPVRRKIADLRNHKPTLQEVGDSALSGASVGGMLGGSLGAVIALVTLVEKGNFPLALLIGVAGVGGGALALLLCWGGSALGFFVLDWFEEQCEAFFFPPCAGGAGTELANPSELEDEDREADPTFRAWTPRC